MITDYKELTVKVKNFICGHMEVMDEMLVGRLYKRTVVVLLLQAPQNLLERAEVIVGSFRQNLIQSVYHICLIQQFHMNCQLNQHSLIPSTQPLQSIMGCLYQGT